MKLGTVFNFLLNMAAYVSITATVRRTARIPRLKKLLKSDMSLKIAAKGVLLLSLIKSSIAQFFISRILGRMRVNVEYSE